MSPKKKSNRKSPHAHTVSGFTKKNGKQVSAYNRGSGAPRPKNKRAKRVVGKPTGGGDIHGYVVNLKYSNRKGDGESILAISDQDTKTILKDYKEILDEAFEEKADSRVPIAVEIVDPSVGELIRVMGRKVEGTIKWGAPKAIRAGKIGAKFAIKATMISARTLKSGAELAAYKGQTMLAESMLKPCWQKDKAKQTAARNALRLRFPTLYDMCEFSRERTISRRRRRRKAPKVNVFPRIYKDVEVN